MNSSERRRFNLRPHLDIEDSLDVIYGPLWLRLLIGHRPRRQVDADHLLDLVWPRLSNKPNAI
jgi:hypothetical protein